MKILFVIQVADFYSPLGLMQISAMARMRGDEVFLSNASKEDIFKKIKEARPDVVAYTCMTGEQNAYARINKKIKELFPKVFTIMGGPHPTFFPEVIDEAALDAICMGEGEYAFLELLNRLDRKEDPSGIKNIVLKGQGPGELRPLVQELDPLPFLDRELFYDKKRPAHVMSFMTSRGCPYDCTYCFNHLYRKVYPGENYLRRHSVDYVFNEIKSALSKMEFKFIRFIDDIFVSRENEWFLEFCRRYPKEIKIPFYVHTRFDLISPGIVEKLKMAGCKSIHMSVESANPVKRAEVLNRKMTDDQIIRAVGYCRKNRISVVANTMLGLPEHGIKDDIHAVYFSIKAKIPVAEFPIFQPYPKTRLGDLCVKNNWFDGDASRMTTYGFSHASVLSCFTPKEKKIQINITVLGPMVVRHPWLRMPVMKFLIYLPPNKFFQRIAVFEKMMAYPRRVYRRKYSLKERLKIIRQGLELEKVKMN